MLWQSPLPLHGVQLGERGPAAGGFSQMAWACAPAAVCPPPPAWGSSVAGGPAWCFWVAAALCSVLKLAPAQ